MAACQRFMEAESRVPGVLDSTGLARRVSVSAVRPLQGLAGSRTSVSVRRVWSADVGDGRTIFQDTRTPLRVWFRAMWCVAGQKTGTSARTLQRVLWLGS